VKKKRGPKFAGYLESQSDSLTSGPGHDQAIPPRGRQILEAMRQLDPASDEYAILCDELLRKS
jgi:hypothetical protein